MIKDKCYAYGANSSNITGITQLVFSPTGEELIIFMLIIALYHIRNFPYLQNSRMSVRYFISIICQHMN